MSEKYSGGRIGLIAFIALIFAALITYFSFYDSPVSSNLGLIIAAVCLIPLTGFIFRKLVPAGLKNKIGEPSNMFLEFFEYLRLIVDELIYNRIGLIVMLVLFVLFAGMGQAQELLLHLSQNWIAPPLFFSFLAILALINWYWTRFVYAKNAKKFALKTFLKDDFKHHYDHKNSKVNHVRGMLPRMIGFIIILIPTLFILTLYLENIQDEKVSWLVLSVTCFNYWVLLIITISFSQSKFYEAIKFWIKERKWIIFVLLGILIVLTAIPLVLSGMESPKKIPFLYSSGVIVAVLYFMVSSLEIEKMLANLIFAKQANKEKNRISYVIFWGSIGVSVFFIAFNFLPVKLAVNGLTILFGGLVLYSLLSYRLIVAGNKTGIPFLTFILIAMIFGGSSLAPNSGLHDVRLVDTTYNAENRVSIDNYIEQWFTHNDNFIKEYLDDPDTNKRFPLVFVSAEGGGSRAAMWTLVVHDFMEKYEPNYYKHIFSMSGASGGNTGNSFYLAYHEANKLNKGSGAMADSVFRNDFVSGDIGLLFGRDSWQSILGLSIWPDRSEVLQQRWEKEFANSFDVPLKENENPLRREFLSFWYDKSGQDMKNSLRFDHPLFLLNTTHIQSGDHATMSAVKIKSFIPQNMDLIQRVSDSLGKSIPLSSGALMNARFPIVCPSGKIPKIGNFVDAGYYDNFGASETRAVMLKVINFLDTNNTYSREDFKIVHLVMRNSLPKDNGEYIMVRSNLDDGLNESYHSELNYTPESIVPVEALAGAAFAHPNRELAEIEHITDASIYFDLKRTYVDISKDDEDEPEMVLPIIPLSRHLSELTIRSMHARMDTIQLDKPFLDSLDSIFNK